MSEITREQLIMATDHGVFDFSGLDLSGLDLSGLDLGSLDLSGCNLSRCNFRDSNLWNTRIGQCNLKDCIGNGVEIVTYQTPVYDCQFTASYLQIGCERHGYDQWWAFDDKVIFGMDEDVALSFWAKYKSVLQSIQQVLGFGASEQTGSNGQMASGSQEQTATSSVICYYHKDDFDGVCSAQVIKRRHPSCTLIPCSYGDVIVLPDHAVVYIVDFSFSAETMTYIDEHNHLIWIDHHAAAFSKCPDALGERRVGIGACVLCWEVLFKEPVPIGVRLLGEYDVFIGGSNALYYQYGLRCFEEVDWAGVLGDAFSEIPSIILMGSHIVAYLKGQRSKQLESCYEVMFADRKLKCINGSLTTLPGDSEQTVAWHWDGGKYIVSLRGEGSLAVALAHQGGGHPLAAGFTCDRLPEWLQPKSTVPKSTVPSLNLYLIERLDTVGWDETISFICSADSEDEALRFEPSGDRWPGRSSLKATPIGQTQMPAGILHTSFLNG